MSGESLSIDFCFIKSGFSVGRGERGGGEEDGASLTSPFPFRCVVSGQLFRGGLR